jgi:hypothetical protein
MARWTTWAKVPSGAAVQSDECAPRRDGGWVTSLFSRTQIKANAHIESIRLANRRPKVQPTRPWTPDRRRRSGQSVARRFGQPHAARDHGVRHLVAEVRFGLFADRRCWCDAPGSEHPAVVDDHAAPEFRVAAYTCNGVHQIGRSLQAQKYCFSSARSTPCTAQPVQRQHAERWRAVVSTKS